MRKRFAVIVAILVLSQAGRRRSARLHQHACHRRRLQPCRESTRNGFALTRGFSRMICWKGAAPDSAAETLQPNISRRNLRPMD